MEDYLAAEIPVTHRLPGPGRTPLPDGGKYSGFPEITRPHLGRENSRHGGGPLGLIPKTPPSDEP